MNLIPQLLFDLEQSDIDNLNPLVLAFVGDAVQTLYVRTLVATSSTLKANMLHQKVSQVVNCKAQANAFSHIENILTEKELAIYKRARNSRCGSIPKNASPIEYKVASGLESLIGYLYLTKQNPRLEELICIAYDTKE